MPECAPYRRFEVLLPLYFNDGSELPQEAFAQTLAELRERFGDLSIETQATRGLSEYGEKSYKDHLIRVYVDVPDEPQHRQFFVDWKVRLKERFQQIDIWLTTYAIEVL